jgi:hypothetical protein
MDRIEKRCLQQLFVAAGTCLSSHCLATTGGYTDRQSLLLFYTDSIGNDASIQTHRQMGGIYEMRRRDGLRCQDIDTKFHKVWLRHSKAARRDT